MKTIKQILIIALIIVSFSYSSNAQDSWGVGVRLGDPTALSIKRYMGNNALEFNIGSSPYGTGYYNSYYNNYYTKKGNPGYNYYGYRQGGNLDLQLHYLIHKDINFIKIDGKLQWYFGGGLQFRYKSFYYNYWDNNGNYYYHVRSSDIDLGLDGVIGAEYTFDNIPISLFADTNLFLELTNTLYPWWQAGIGARYKF